MIFRPELLAPAGNLEKLKVAVLYGADAVYLSGQRFGMRAGADNFTNADIERGVAFAKRRNVKIYVTINTFFHDEDFEGLKEFCEFLQEQGVSGVIVSDLGVVEFIRECSSIDVHVSTQSSCLNVAAAKVWKDAGATRVVVGRELSIEQSRKIKDLADIEVEMFVHGAMCMAYSGNCVISNFTAGRDSNRGGCIQSCRYSYKQSPKRGLTVLNDNTVESHFISSKDMLGVAHIPHFIDARIDSLKIEGRMKSPMYVATTTASYRRAIDLALEGKLGRDMIGELSSELNSIPHRDYFDASFETPAPSNSTYEENFGTSESGTHRFVGLVLDTSRDLIALRSYTKIEPGSQLEFVRFNGAVLKVAPTSMFDCLGTKLECSKPGGVVCVPRFAGAEDLSPFNVVRERICAA